MNTEEWLKSKPKRHSNNIDSKSSTCGSSFRKIIKMIKWWNKKHSSFLQSYHIEVMALKVFNSNLSDISWDVFSYFNEASNLIKYPLWHEDSFCDNYLAYQKRESATQRLETARDKARDAWYKTTGNDDHEGAIKIWRQIFGEKFPAYGT